MHDFINTFQNSIPRNNIVKVSFSKPRNKKEQLINVYVRPIELKGELCWNVVSRYKTNDQTHNYTSDKIVPFMEDLLTHDFFNATLMTTTHTYSFLSNKKGHGTLLAQPNQQELEVQSKTHNRVKKVRIRLDQPYLKDLGIINQDHQVIPSMSDKYKQINKYLEIMEGLLVRFHHASLLTIVDMGSGMGYLTFALYDYVQQNFNIPMKVIGVELRQELVDKCNAIAQKNNLSTLHFVNQRIEEFKENEIDVLIALHACDTATDDAIYGGVMAKASVIVCAPCCHKALRQQLKGVHQESPLLKYGIYQERQYEMVTDTFRALWLETKQYETKIFEFVSNEHTRKNIMLVAEKNENKHSAHKALEALDALKKTYHFDNYYLENKKTQV
jgi:hypothetical protein